jgi:hypothetical protein
MQAGIDGEPEARKQHEPRCANPTCSFTAEPGRRFCLLCEEIQQEELTDRCEDADEEA